MLLEPHLDAAIPVATLKALLARFPDTALVVVNHVGNLAVLSAPPDTWEQIGYIALGSEEATVYDGDGDGSTHGWLLAGR
jgi:hypothetical protein